MNDEVDEDDCGDDDSARWGCLYIETTNKVGLRRDLGDRDSGWITNIGHRRITLNTTNHNEPKQIKNIKRHKPKMGFTYKYR